MKTIMFIIPGQPTAKGRPRMTRGGHAYTPAKTRNYEAFVKMCFLEKYAQETPITGPVELKVHAAFTIPKSWSKKRKAAADHHTSRPDLDNIVKAIKDALNGIAWVDDSQVCGLLATKRYVTGAPCVAVHIKNYTGE